MAPIIALILSKVLDFLASHAEEIIVAIREAFPIFETDSAVNAAIQELGYNPSQESLDALAELLKEKGEDPGKLAAILVNKTIV